METQEPYCLFPETNKAVSQPLSSKNSYGLWEACQLCPLYKLLNPLKSPFPHLKNGYENNCCLAGLQWIQNKVI